MEGSLGQVLARANTATPSCAASSVATLTASICTQWGRTKTASPRSRFSKVTQTGEASKTIPRRQSLKMGRTPRALPLLSLQGLGIPITRKSWTSLQHLILFLLPPPPPRRTVLLHISFPSLLQVCTAPAPL
jgi:hypothetical protein